MHACVNPTLWSLQHIGIPASSASAPWAVALWDSVYWRASKASTKGLQEHQARHIGNGLVCTIQKCVDATYLQVYATLTCLVVVQEGFWHSGLCQGHNLADSDRVWAAIDDSLQNKAGSAQRLYFLDGTFPGQLPEGCSSHEDVPGELVFL